MKDHPWPETGFAVSFSFDDARPSQADNAIPVFAEFDAPATFYVSTERAKERLEVWKRAVTAGHEIGNHTNTHPCSGNFPFGREKALEDFTLERMRNDIKEADAQIELLLGVRPTTFAYPCGQTYVGRGVHTQSYVPLTAERFDAARGFGEGAINDSYYCNLHQLASFDIDGAPPDRLVTIMESAVASGGWVIFTSHDVGASGVRQTTYLESLRKALSLARRRDSVFWVASVADAAKRVIAASSRDA